MPSHVPMLRAETVGGPKVIRGGRCPTARPQLSRHTTSTASDKGGNEPAISFLDMPYELRLMIYEHLLISPDPVMISPHRRHLRYRVLTRPATNGNTYLWARRPTPEKYLVRQEDKLHAGILSSCRQINREATHILYGKNKFIVGQFLPMKGGGAQSAIKDGYHALYFFLWHIRQSTLMQITSITFRKACYCTNWLLLDFKEFKTDGPTLRQVVFRGARPGWLPPTRPGWLLPTPPCAKEAFCFINTKLLTCLTGLPFMGCFRCRHKYGTY